MSFSPAEPVMITVDAAHRVSGLLQLPNAARACFIFAHGAGAGMEHAFMADIANELGARDIATLRYQFPYLEQGSRRPDPPKLCHATVRAAVSEVVRLVPALPLFAGGKSFGGRMTSQAQAISPVSGVQGLILLGFPLHPAGHASDERGRHLSDVQVPMLFLQGTQDKLADLSLIQSLTQQLGARATLKLLQDADHSFHVPARIGRKDAEIRSEMLDAVVAWIDQHL